MRGVDALHAERSVDVVHAETPLLEFPILIVTVGPELIDKHAGRIRVESTPGMGTCFTLQLPLDVRAAGTS